jgi:amphi-Trp domain-containing protein
MKRKLASTVRKKKKRDVEKVYSRKIFVSKLRRLADSLEKGKSFRIQVGGERITVPEDVITSVEHERDGGEELEFQIKWKREKKERRR